MKDHLSLAGDPAGEEEEGGQGEKVEGEGEFCQHQVERDCRQGAKGAGGNGGVAAASPGGKEFDKEIHSPESPVCSMRYTSRSGRPFSSAILRQSSNSGFSPQSVTLKRIRPSFVSRSSILRSSASRETG